MPFFASLCPQTWSSCFSVLAALRRLALRSRGSSLPEVALGGERCRSVALFTLAPLREMALNHAFEVLEPAWKQKISARGTLGRLQLEDHVVRSLDGQNKPGFMSRPCRIPVANASTRLTNWPHLAIRRYNQEHLQPDLCSICCHFLQFYSSNCRTASYCRKQTIHDS